MSALSPDPLAHQLGVQDARSLDDAGYLMLRGAVPEDWIGPLRGAFEADVMQSDQWPVPRGVDWRHALVDLDPTVQRVCRLPALLAAASHVLGGPFFLAQVEGREPRAGGGAQLLHRDGPGSSEVQSVSVLVFLDPFGPENGATQLVPGSHRRMDIEGSEESVLAQARPMQGQAGDVLLYGSTLLHGATLNQSGAPRRSLLISYVIEDLRDSYDQTRKMRAVRMDTSELFGA
jgi:hypothetical protein